MKAPGTQLVSDALFFFPLCLGHRIGGRGVERQLSCPSLTARSFMPLLGLYSYSVLADPRLVNPLEGKVTGSWQGTVHERGSACFTPLVGQGGTLRDT